jgi:hypothetical protein
MTSFWLNNPSILLKQSDISELWPQPDMSMERKLNSITRLIVLLTLLGYLITRKDKFLITGVITLVVIVILYFIQNKKEKDVEGFTLGPDAFKLTKNNFIEPTNTNPTNTKPTITNPAMNVLLTEIVDNPERKPAELAYEPSVNADINKQTIDMVKKNFNDPNIDVRLFKDLGDSYVFDQSMRTWYATPNTQIPNDQGAFADFCYGDMISCRDETNNEEACARNMPPRWTNY